jgi:hypothetical protein
VATRRRPSTNRMSWEDIAQYASEQARSWAEEFIAEPERDEDGFEIPRPRQTTLRGQPVEVYDPLDWWEIAMAEEGDDSYLLPYAPTPSSYPPRPRTQAAGYNRRRRELRVKFRDGSRYVYKNVPPNIWANFKRVKSPGRFINRVLNAYPYERETGPEIDDSIYDRFRTRSYRTEWEKNNRVYGRRYNRRRGTQ